MRQHKASRKKRERALEKGNLLRLTVANRLFNMIIVIAIVCLFKPLIWVKFTDLLNASWSELRFAQRAYTTLLRDYFGILVLLLFSSSCLLISLNGFKLRINFNVINFLKNFGNLFKDARFNIVALFVIILYLTACFFFIKPEVLALLYSPEQNLYQQMLVRFAVLSICLMLVLILLEYLLKKHTWLKNLAMSEQELRDELKEDTRNPEMMNAEKEFFDSILIRELEKGLDKTKLIITNF